MSLGRLSFWRYVALIEGWNRAHADPNAPPEPMSADEFRDMVKRLG